MPELPEVETIRRDLARLVRGKTIRSVVIKQSMRGADRRILRALRGSTVFRIARRGKLLIFELRRTVRSASTYLLAHLMMTGRLLFGTARGATHHYTRAIIFFTDGSTLTFTDVRRLGWMEVVDEEGLRSLVRRFGIEPLTSTFTLSAFRTALGRRRASVKGVLLDQRTIAGLGNIYADEACFNAGVRPDRAADSLTNTELCQLHRACIVVVRQALQSRGTTFATFLDGRGRAGGFGEFLAVYGRAGKRCRRCRRGVIAKVRLASRGTSFCPTCQH